jgi:predicted short-subunit dehydrogenase-like oxidoreductase (DUF2520 family)
MMLQKGITIIGSGNVAWHLAHAFKNAGVNIVEVISRNIVHARELAERLNTGFKSDLASIDKNASDIVLICVSDSAVEEVVKLLPDVNAVVAHTAGCLPLESVGIHKERAGVFYPFQTFSKVLNPGKLSFPVCIEGSDKESEEILMSLANEVSNKVVRLNSKQRSQLHLAGVIANNFSNHLIARSFDFLETNNIERSLIIPILEQTINNLKFNHPKEIQTGPARRGDWNILKEHQKMLVDQPELGKIYEELSESILSYYHKQN